MKLLTYNIWFSDLLINKRLNKLINIIQINNPDVICLQEVRRDVLAILVNKLNKYIYWETSLREDKYYGIAIFSKIKILSKGIYKFKNTKMDRHFIKIKINYNNQNINIITTHLESEFLKKSNSKYEESLKKSNKYLQFYNLINFFENKNTSILCGDFNISNNDDKFFILNNKWNDAWIIDGSQIEKKNTFDSSKNMYLNSKSNYKSRLDRIYYNSSKIKQINFNLIGNYKDDIIPSDHFGLLLKIEI